jgi:RNA polymerase sigma factor (TIGR02999 family)
LATILYRAVLFNTSWLTDHSTFIIYGMPDFTHIFAQIESGDPSAGELLLPLVYAELRKLAARELHSQPSGITLQPTALVHEAYLRLMDQSTAPQWSHRGHFYAAAAEAMRRILVESARRKQTLKRGGDRQRILLDAEQITDPHRHPDLLALDEALERLAVDHPEIARLVSLKYFAGLTMEQTAQVLGLSLRTAERNWTYARAWLLEAVGDE